MVSGNNGNPGLVDGNHEITRVVSPNFDETRVIPINVIQNTKSRKMQTWINDTERTSRRQREQI